MTKVKLLLADKREIFHKGLAELLEHEWSIEVLGTCCTVSEAVELATEHQPDIILIDTELPECGGIEAIRRIHETSARSNIIMLTHSEVDADLFSSIRAGAKAYLSKDVSVENLIKAITLVAQGEVIVSPPMAARLLTEFNVLEERKDGVELRDITLLSKREEAVLSLVAQGFTNKEIATTLGISENTVKVHLRNIMEKLQAHTRQQAVALVRGKDLLPRVTKTDTKQV